jgi:hypothetical protein
MNSIADGGTGLLAEKYGAGEISLPDESLVPK